MFVSPIFTQCCNSKLWLRKTSHWKFSAVSCLRLKGIWQGFSYLSYLKLCFVIWPGVSSSFENHRLNARGLTHGCTDAGTQCAVYHKKYIQGLCAVWFLLTFCMCWLIPMTYLQISDTAASNHGASGSKLTLKSIRKIDCYLTPTKHSKARNMSVTFAVVSSIDGPTWQEWGRSCYYPLFNSKVTVPWMPVKC